MRVIVKYKSSRYPHGGEIDLARAGVYDLGDRIELVQVEERPERIVQLTIDKRELPRLLALLEPALPGGSVS